MSNAPLMPVATAVWLVENTSLTFKQIAEFCKMHEVEVRSIADGEVGKGIVGFNPIIAGQLSVQSKKDKKYIPLSKRQDKPDSALWLLKNHSKLKDSQIAKLVGITSASVKAIRNKSYWNFNSLNPKDPVAIGLFSQKDLLESLEKADRRIKREQKIKKN